MRAAEIVVDDERRRFVIGRGRDRRLSVDGRLAVSEAVVVGVAVWPAFVTLTFVRPVSEFAAIGALPF